MSWIEKARAANRNFRKTSGPEGKAYLGIIGTLNPDTERCMVYHMFAQEVRSLHPFQSPNSWIRVAPEAGTGVLVADRWDTEENEIFAYYNKYPERGVEAYREGNDVRRPLNEGEIEISSRGYAQSYHDDRGNLHLRGGMTWMKLDTDRMCVEAKAPWHHRMLSNTTVMSLGDEERFGTVVRPGELAAPLEKFITAGPIPLKEYYRSLGSLLIPTGKLVEHHEGDIVDQFGFPTIFSPLTEAPLRAFSRWFTATGQKVEASIDILGNVDFKTPAEAIVGINVKVPTGKVTLSALLGIDLTGGPVGPVTVTTTGVWATGSIVLDGLNWGTHAHITATGTSSGPIPGV